MKIKPFRNIRILFLATLLAASLVTSGQSNETLYDSLANDPVLFINFASKHLKWQEPSEPQKVVGPIYFVGTKGLSSFLITTPEGHILLYTGMPSSGSMIEKSIRNLGFKPEDIKILLTGHAHSDHVGGHAYIKKISGAQVFMMDTEKELMESGGKSDFHYGNYREYWFDPVRVDRVLHDGDSVNLGDITMKALFTPGHTKGGTTWVMNVYENRRKYLVVFPEGTSINPGYRLVVNPSYPGIVDNYKATFSVLEKLKPDIWLSSHTDFFNFEEKRSREVQTGKNAFVDPEGYKVDIEEARVKFYEQIKKEKASVGKK